MIQKMHRKIFIKKIMLPRPFKICTSYICTSVHGHQAILVDLHASDASMLCGFRFELEFHTTNSLRECYNVTRDFCYNSQGVCIKKYITPEEYIAHLMDVVGDAKNNYLTSGTNAGAPSILQQEEMAKILNATGYSSTKWIGLVRKKKSVAKIQKDVDEEEKDDEIGF